MIRCVHRPRRVPAGTCPDRVYGSEGQLKNEAAAGALRALGTLNRLNRRQPPSRLLTDPRTTPMTVPAIAGAAHARITPDTLPPTSHLGPVPSKVLASALDAEISHRAFRVLAAALFRLPLTEWWSVGQIGDAAGLSNHQARPFVGELVKANILMRVRKIVYVDGVPRDQHRYTLEVAR